VAMSKQAAFWDASALVPLCVQEASSRQAHTQLRKFMPVVWWGSPVEVHSAIARLHGSGNLKDVEKQGALSRLDLLSRGWREILPGDHVRDLAQRLLDTHELRAADSLQLAAALTWCQQRPARRDFICADQQLSKAATAAGFIVLELS
ncbi:MAG TPA: type II toxin-antitoxin system VapC family toxin, partial [Candidatus Elarobacter sp.]|nr:type II toxin-antitoxin system VapC family toxin [Candidatus Elarobacter sp.]